MASSIKVTKVNGRMTFAPLHLTFFPARFRPRALFLVLLREADGNRLGFFISIVYNFRNDLSSQSPQTPSASIHMKALNVCVCVCA